MKDSLAYSRQSRIRLNKKTNVFAWEPSTCKRRFMNSPVILLNFTISKLSQFRKCPYAYARNSNYKDSAVASRLVRSSPDRAVRVRALAGDIVLCSWVRHLILTVPLSTQVYKWVPANLMLNPCICFILSVGRPETFKKRSLNETVCKTVLNLSLDTEFIITL